MNLAMPNLVAGFDGVAGPSRSLTLTASTPACRHALRNFVRENQARLRSIAYRASFLGADCLLTYYLLTKP